MLKKYQVLIQILYSGSSVAECVFINDCATEPTDSFRMLANRVQIFNISWTVLSLKYCTELYKICIEIF